MAMDDRARSLPLLVDAIERDELSLEAVVRMLLGRLEKMELRLVKRSRVSDVDEDRSREILRPT